MAKAYFPDKDKAYIQTNRSNIYPFSNLWSTMNCDFQSNLGALRISPRMKLNVTSATLTNLGLPIAFKFFDGKMFAIGGTRIFKAAAPFTTTAFVEDTSTNAPTTFNAFSDMEVVPDDTLTTPVLVATINSAIWKKSADGSGGGDWFSVGSLTATTNHKIAYFKQFNRTYYLNNTASVASSDSLLASVDTTGDYTLTLTSSANGKAIYSLNCIATSSSSVWLGSMSLPNGDLTNRASLFQWDGISAQPTSEFRVNAHGIVAIIIGDDDACYLMDTNGILGKCTGYGIQEIGRLPVNSSKTLLNAGQAVTGQFMCSNGLAFTKNGTLLAVVTGLNEDGSQNENFASGVYEFDLNGGCTHHRSASMNPIGSSTITDFGQNRLEAAGAIINTSNLNVGSVQQSNLLIGATFRNASLSSVSGIFVDNFQDDVQKKGYFVTDFFESDEIEDEWERYWASLRKFLDDNDKVVFKYRNYEEDPVSVSDLAWVSTTIFTVPNSSVDISDYWTSGIGGEVEIMAGTGAGACVHITDAVLAGGTWTVTIDNAITGVSGSSYARFQKWIKILDEMTIVSAPNGWQQFAIGANAPRIQIKGCLTLTGQGEFYKSAIFSNHDINITN